MRRLLASALLMFFASCALAQSGTLDKVRKSGALTLGYIDNAVPFSFVAEGKPRGYSVELCERVASDIRQQLKLQKLDVRWVALTVQNRLEAVRKGQVDMECSTTTVTLGRQKEVDFSLMTFVDGSSILIRQPDNDLYVKLSDFIGKRIAVLAGTTTEKRLGEALAKARVDAKLVRVAKRPEALELLAKKEVEGFASDRVALVGVVTSGPQQGVFKLLEEIYSVEPYAFALRRGDRDFKLAVDRAIAGLYRDGGIADVYNNWLGRLGPPPPMLAAMYALQGLSE